MKIAVVGSGASAFACVDAVRRLDPQAAIHVFEHPAAAPPPALAARDYRTWTAAEFDALHREVRGALGVSFPPPLSRFGETPTFHAAEGRLPLYASAHPGGLTRWWSGSLLPFTQEDLAGWPTSRSELGRWYRQIAEVVGIAGRVDALERYYGETFVNRPALELSPVEEALIEAANRRSGAAPEVFAGTNRLAVETRPVHPRSCVYCGGCHYGCFRGSIFDAGEALGERATELRTERVPTPVLRFRAAGGSVSVCTAEGEHGGYDRLFCAAGCIGSAELVLRSLGEPGASTRFLVKQCVAFPILYLGRRASSGSDHFPLSTTIVGHRRGPASADFTELHVAKLPDLLLRYYLPGRLWPAVRWLARRLRARVLLCLLQLHTDRSGVRFDATIDGGGGLSLAQRSEVDLRQPARSLLRDLRSALAGAGFFVPPLVVDFAGAHYCGGFDAGAGRWSAGARGEVAPRVHLVDGSLFPSCPAQGPTFTLMANAARIASEALEG